MNKKNKEAIVLSEHDCMTVIVDRDVKPQYEYKI